ncbi:MAG: hypothetical protein KAT01_09405 [Candidatus Aminicenantes bacterium]|jgi:hypothetical protein|nr:hypothetical protein [Candidatus Aminicenantes bacterium]
MAVFEVESWLVKEGKEEEHKKALRGWFQWVNQHRELFKEWKSVRYFEKTVAGEESGRHLMMWEYESMADFEAYKKRRSDYSGPYEEYKTKDPYHMGVFQHNNMKVEFWKDLERDLWIE